MTDIDLLHWPRPRRRTMLAVVRMRTMCKSGADQSGTRSRSGDTLLIDTGQPLQTAARVVRWRTRRALSKAAGLLKRG
jgi:hypothetical protein